MLTLADDDDSAANDRWSLLAWARGAGVHRVIAAALQRATRGSGLGTDTQAALDFVRQLRDRDQLSRLLRAADVTDGIVDLVWREVLALQAAGVATSDEVQSKFAGAIELSYGGLEQFFGGLEAVTGPPNPNVHEAMEEEHLRRGDESTQTFVSGNYEVRTSSLVEWHFVMSADLTPSRHGLDRWPEESAEKMPDRTKCRRKSPPDAFDGAVAARNGLLQAARQPTLTRGDLCGARLYTGPLFVKYNAVLRGLQSDSPFLRNTMVSLCCPQRVAAAYQGTAPMHALANGALSFEQARAQLNRYSTTLHAINSAIVKLGKLTMASKVYRGIAGMALPREFWQPNSFGVKGGVEPAFMSTTTERHVAMGYAAGDGSRMGVVLEVRQGMVNRGAELSWLSQYPHESEVLFGPLTGIEVLGSRVDGGVVVIECDISINLASGTLEQVLGKRRKVVADMCEQLVARARQAAQEDGWEVVRVRTVRDAEPVPRAVSQFLEERLTALSLRAAEHYNDNAPLGEAIQEAVAVAEGLVQWPQGLHALVTPSGKGDGAKRPPWVATGADAGRAGRLEAQRDAESREAQRVAAQLLIGSPVDSDTAPHTDAAAGPSSETVEGPLTVAALAEWKGPLLLEQPRGSQRAPAPRKGWLHGACALIWMMQAKQCELGLDLRRICGPKSSSALSVLSRSLAPSLTALDLSQNNLTNTAGDFSGLNHFCDALRGGFGGGLRELKLAGCDLRDEGAAALIPALLDVPLTTLDLSSADQGNHLGVKSMRALAQLLQATRTLTSLNVDYTELGDKRGPKSGAAFAEGLAGNGTLRSLRMRGCSLGAAGGVTWEKVAAALGGSQLTDLDVGFNDFKGSDAQILARLLAGSKITSLACGANSDIRGDDAEQLASALLGHAPLEKLCGVPLGEMREGRRQLTELDLSKYRTGGLIGVLVLRELLPLQRSLASLDLANNGLQCSAVQALSTVLSSLGALTRLVLSGNRIASKGLEALAGALPSTSISYLDLNQNPDLNGKSGAAGLVALAACLKDTRLVELRLEGMWDMPHGPTAALAEAARSIGAIFKEDTDYWDPFDADRGDDRDARMDAMAEEMRKLTDGGERRALAPQMLSDAMRDM